MRLKEFLENKINNKEIVWDNKSQLIKASGEKVNGNNIKILKIYEKKFKFGSVQKIKDQEILKYFSKQPKNSFISVEGAKKNINENLPKNITEKPKGRKEILTFVCKELDKSGGFPFNRLLMTRRGIFYDR